MKKTALLFLLLFSLSGLAQFSKTHYIPALTAQNGMAGDQYLYISTPNISNVNFKIIAIGGAITNAVVSNSNPYLYHIGNGNDTPLFIPKTQLGKVNNKGYIIEAEDLIYVSARLNSGMNSNTGVYSHAGGLVSKGNSALGKEFRVGAMLNPLYDPNLLNFASILSTENNTKVTISNLPIGTVFADGTIYLVPITIMLNKNESYVFALQNFNNSSPISNSSKIIGALIESDKAVVVNSGSIGGSNSSVANANGVATSRDVGFDQIVPFEKTGNEYIFVKGNGTDELERVLLIAHKAQTAIYLNGDPTPFTTLANPGDYTVMDGSQFLNGNLYVATSENVFAYQSIAGTDRPANQNMFFVPALNCATPNSVDNIPLIESIGDVTFTGGLNVVTETGALVKINGQAVTAVPVAITGNPKFVRYSFVGLSGNIAVKSDKQVYVSYFGTNGAATYGGYYSGFDLKPEIVTDKISIENTSCIPNVNLKINTLSSYDKFQWFKNDVEIAGETNNQYTPTTPGFYQVRGSISACGTTIFSDKIPVSECPSNMDNDLANDNIDIDNDNDGVTNCNESYGNQNIDISASSSKTITVADYTNSFTETISTAGSALQAGTFTGNIDGSFISEIPAGKDNSLTYKITFAKPISTGIEYVSTANTTDLLNADAEYVVNSDTNKTLTVLNPDNQLVIDTNYDGIYETGVTEFSSFEIRFRLNSTIPLMAGTGTFRFLTYLSNSIYITHKNLSETNVNRMTMKFFASCVPKDTDVDGIPDSIDADSDGDGIADNIEIQANSNVLISNTDTNKNGLDNAFEPGFTPIDTDKDGITDYLDLDSDNDGILDAVETEIDSDADGIRNYRDLDSDKDVCPDVVEAGFADSNSDGILGAITPPTVDKNGLVTSGIGYSFPNSNYNLSAPIIITSQPKTNPVCELQNTTITLLDNADSYQWQLSTDGINWNNLTNNSIYSNVNSNTLTIANATNAMSSHKYRVVLNKTGNTCGLTSDEISIVIYPLPIVNEVTIIQCDDDLDGISTFNLTVKNNAISSNFANETFTYYTSLSGANSANATDLIANTTAFVNTTANTMPIWARITNANGCFSVAKITLKVSATQIDATSFHRDFTKCDDANPSDTDGFSEFDFQSVTADIQNELPSSGATYSIKYYASEADALSETNEITNTSSYRNTTKNKQDIWVRVDSDLDNACFGLGAFVSLIVSPMPRIDLNSDGAESEIVCSNRPAYFVTLHAGIQGNSPTSDYTYIWSKDGTVLNDKTATIDVNTEGIYSVEVINNSGCSRIRTIKVNTSDDANIQNIEIEDLTEINKVIINVTGTGNYEYSLDEPLGYFQDSNIFSNVIPGIHEIYINDKNGCGAVHQEIAVIGVPNFFTPNQDGHNDYWNLKGINSSINANTIIYIFDRYGKLLTKVAATSQGWDGTLNGIPLPSTDYWYSIKLEDGREARGHFSLKR